jgi:YD repeat-containing protein
MADLSVKALARFGQLIKRGVGYRTAFALADTVTAEDVATSSLPTPGVYTYDQNDNVIEDPDGNTYTWNADGSVASQSVGGVTRFYNYDARGNIVSVT